MQEKALTQSDVEFESQKILSADGDCGIGLVAAEALRLQCCW